MKKTIRRNLLSAIVLLGLAATLSVARSQDERGATPKTDEVKDSLTMLKEKWSTGVVNYLVIEHISSTAEYPVEFLPETLDARAPFKFVLMRPQQLEVTKAFLTRVDKLDPVRLPLPRPEGPYVRWGFQFLDQKGYPLATIYLDKTGNEGYLNNTPVAFHSQDLFHWAETTFDQIFR